MTDDRTHAASSPDGRTFSLDAGGPTVAPGDLLVVQHPADPVLGQVVGPSGGVVLGSLADGRFARAEIGGFRSAPAVPATAEDLAAVQASTGAGVTIGTWRTGAVEAPARLRAQGFNRHTFLCGQSGSGKTYALGVLLEQMLLATDLRMVIFDPNADFVRIGETKAETGAEDAERIGRLDVRVLGAAPPAEPLRMRFATMPRPAQAAVLRLDPLADRDEYNLLVHTLSAHHTQPRGIDVLIEELLQGGADERALAQRVQNLGLDAWEVWAGAQPSAAEIVAEGPRVTVLDLAGFHDPRESTAVALDLVEKLWAQRQTRTPTLIVIDEAHNICPATPVGSIQTLLVERLVQIAAEGRKYGLWLLLSTQRPSKVHQQVLSQCDNLVLMRMNSPGDVAEIADVFGFAPPAMIGAAPYFRQGEAVMAGQFAPCPMRVRMGARLTFEGGSDVSVPISGH